MAVLDENSPGVRPCCFPCRRMPWGMGHGAWGMDSARKTAGIGLCIAETSPDA